MWKAAGSFPKQWQGLFWIITCSKGGWFPLQEQKQNILTDKLLFWGLFVRIHWICHQHRLFWDFLEWQRQTAGCVIWGECGTTPLISARLRSFSCFLLECTPWWLLKSVTLSLIDHPPWATPALGSVQVLEAFCFFLNQFFFWVIFNCWLPSPPSQEHTRTSPVSSG